MNRTIESVDRNRVTFFSYRLEDWIDADNPVQVCSVTDGNLLIFINHAGVSQDD